ncbi:MAG TPA: type II toxin-antitoxin system VapC family toxin [Stellaceae bacterium]|nr:type II toxin-antitoxin system VapC family toxin [Stellaceae bacterium]
MRITADTNVLVRATVVDEAEQSRRAMKLLAEADLVAMPLAALCEFVWVARRTYRRPAREVGDVIRVWLASPNVELDVSAVEAGLAVLDAGGDFADGVIAFAGRRLGGTVFASFDRKAVELVAAARGETLLLGD